VTATRARRLATLLALAVLAASAQETPPARRFDPAHTRFGFELRTRWGQRILGAFPRHAGEVLTLPDGRLQVRIALDAGAVTVEDSRRWSALARGEAFFDAARSPRIDFLSEPFSHELLYTGGPLRGMLTLRGRRRFETFMLDPGHCQRPGLDCDLTGRGLIHRAHYGMDGWTFVLSDRVRLDLRVRVLEAP